MLVFTVLKIFQDGISESILGINNNLNNSNNIIFRIL